MNIPDITLVNAPPKVDGYRFVIKETNKYTFAADNKDPKYYFALIKRFINKANIYSKGRKDKCGVKSKVSQ